MFKKHPGKYNLILMDVHMPEMDGYKATRKIRGFDYAEAKKVPIIAMTGNVFGEDIERCLSAGMNDHIGKPVDIDELFTKLKQYSPPKPAETKENIPHKPADHASVNTSTDYAEFLPVINVQDGLSRLMNNKKLYFSLLGKFKGRQMADQLIQNIQDADFAKAVQAAHALKGVAANLGLTELMNIASNIEIQAKSETASVQLMAALDEATNKVIRAINTLLQGN